MRDGTRASLPGPLAIIVVVLLLLGACTNVPSTSLSSSSGAAEPSTPPASAAIASSKPTSPRQTSAPTTALGATPTTASASPPALAGPGVAGRVTAATTGASVGGTDVIAYRGGAGCYAAVASAVTDGAGRYVLALPAGRYCLRFVPPGASRLAPQWWKASATLGTVTEIDVSAAMEGIDAVLVRGFLVSGRVTSGGAAAVSAVVWVQTTWGSNYNAVAFETSDASGAFRTVVPAGTYVLRVTVGSQSYYWNGSDPLARSGPSATLVVERDISDIVLAIP